MQDSYQHLRAVMISLIRWYTILKNYKDEHNRMNTGLLTSGEEVAPCSHSRRVFVNDAHRSHISTPTILQAPYAFLCGPWSRMARLCHNSLPEGSASTMHHVSAALPPAGLLGIVPDALYCTAAHAEQVRQQLEQQAQQQRSSSALQKAAQPLNEMLVLSATLLELQAECYRKPHFLFPNETSTAAIKSAFRSASSLTGASAVMTAIWHCESVLQACLGAATGQFTMGKYKPKARLLETPAMCAADL